MWARRPSRGPGPPELTGVRRCPGTHPLIPGDPRERLCRTSPRAASTSARGRGGTTAACGSRTSTGTASMPWPRTATTRSCCAWPAAGSRRAWAGCPAATSWPCPCSTTASCGRPPTVPSRSTPTSARSPGTGPTTCWSTRPGGPTSGTSASTTRRPTRTPAGPRPAAASLTCVSPGGQVTEAAAGLMFPNGMVLTPDGATLIVAETYAARLTAFDVAADGTLSGRRTWADLSGAGIYPDGICLDADGAVWVANARQPSCIRVQAGGEILREERFSQRCYACALGGADRQTLYVMTAPTSAAARAAE